MNPRKGLAIATFVLAGLFVAQVVILRHQQPPTGVHASWINFAGTLADGVDQSQQVVLGEVVRIRKAPDIVVIAKDPAGGPPEIDRVPTELVTVKVIKSYKGSPDSSEGPNSKLKLFHTGYGSQPRLASPEAQGPHGPRHAKGPRARGEQTGEDRPLHLEDDPPYQEGERYVLFLREGPDFNGTRSSKRVIAPEGRYRITAEDMLDPVTKTRGFAPNWAGRPLTELEDALAALP